MSKKLYSVVIKGNSCTWSFNCFLDPKHIPDYIEDGLEIYEMVNIIPASIPVFLIKPYIFLQDLWHFKWLSFIINKIKEK